MVYCIFNISIICCFTFLLFPNFSSNHSFLFYFFSLAYFSTWQISPVSLSALLFSHLSNIMLKSLALHCRMMVLVTLVILISLERLLSVTSLDPPSWYIMADILQYIWLLIQRFFQISVIKAALLSPLYLNSFSCWYTHVFSNLFPEVIWTGNGNKWIFVSKSFPVSIFLYNKS